MGQKRLGGQITILASLIFGAVVSLITATVSSAAFSAGFLKADLVTQAGVASEFSQYFRPLADYFDVFALEIIDDMDREMETYMYRSIENDNSLIPLKLSCVSLYGGVKMTDNCGLPIKDEIVKYMKYGVVSDGINMLTGNETYRKKCEIVNDLSTALSDAAEMVIEMDECLIEAAHWIDGLKLSKGAFAVEFGVPVYSEDVFFKMAVGEKNPMSIGITDGRVYTAVSGQCHSLTELIMTALAYYELGENISGDCAAITRYITDSINAGNRARNCCISYKNKQVQLGNELSIYSGKLDSARETVGEEIYNGFHEEQEEMSKYASGQTKGLFDADEMMAALDSSLSDLNYLKDLVRSFQQSAENHTDSSRTKEIAAELVWFLSKYNLSDITIDYSNIRFVKENGVMALLKSLYKNIGKGLFATVTEGKSISKERVNTTGLARSKYSEDKNKIAKASTTVLEKALFTEYIGERFDSFAEAGNNGGGQNDDGGLKYDLEFILCGYESDDDNLSATLHEIVNMRQGVNMMSLMADSEKKKEAHIMAATLLGFTGSNGLIKAGQLLILTAWAYAESVMDAKRLVNGEKLDFYKAKADWKMSLSKVIAFDYSINDFDKKTKGLLSYKDYVKFLIMIQRESALYYGTMSAMELRLVAAGYEKFRMENFLYAVCGQASFLINGQAYDRKFEYAY